MSLSERMMYGQLLCGLIYSKYVCNIFFISSLNLLKFIDYGLCVFTCN